jgi:dihydrofolate synthase / folylpolyglutamate synthase
VITPVSLDHQQYLGDTIEQIAFEKAGILKRGVPCVVGPQGGAARAVIEDRAMAVGAPLIAEGEHWQVREEHGRMVFQDLAGLLDLPLPNLIGAHQVENAGAALAALRELGIDETRLRRGGRPGGVAGADAAAAARAAGRSGRDGGAVARRRAQPGGGRGAGRGGGAAAGAAAAPDRRHAEHQGHRRLPAAAGDRRADAARGQHPRRDRNVVRRGDGGRGAGGGLRGDEASGSVGEAVAAIVAAEPQARILICGSLYLAGRVLRENWLGVEQDPPPAEGRAVVEADRRHGGRLVAARRARR